MRDIFAQNTNACTENVSANTRTQSTFYNHCNPKKVNYKLQTLRFLGPKVWVMIPVDVKISQSLSIFKSKIKQWVPHNCPCRLCKEYIPQLGFL